MQAFLLGGQEESFQAEFCTAVLRDGNRLIEEGLNASLKSGGEEGVHTVWGK